jgi:hypothetical protein
MGMGLDSGHSVDPNQFEPGIPKLSQADSHTQQFLLFSADLHLTYVLSERIQLGVSLPFRTAVIDAQFLDAPGKEIPGFTSIHHRTETLSGLGDLGFLGRFRLLSRSKEQPLRIDLVGGFSLPTGNIEPNPFALGRMGKAHQHIFFGRGTVDPRLGLQVEWATTMVNLIFDSNWSGSVYENRYDYQGPQTLSLGLTAAPYFGFERWQFRFGAELVKEFPAQWSGEIAENSGRLDIVPFLGANWSVSEAASLSLTVKRPIVIDTDGGQLEVPLVFLLAGSISLDPQSDPHKD